MQNQNTKINFLVGLFVLGGIIALLFLALQAANTALSNLLCSGLPSERLRFMRATRLAQHRKVSRARPHEL